MAFALKLTRYYESIAFKDEVKYFSQSIDVLNKRDFSTLILLTDGSDPDEVDVSITLKEAKEKRIFLMKHIKTKNISVEIVEFPEVTPDD